MTHEEAIRSLNSATDRLFKEFEAQRESIRQLGEDMDRLVEVFGNIYSHVTPSIRKPKYPVSPYAKFDKYHKKNKKRK